MNFSPDVGNDPFNLHMQKNHSHRSPYIKSRVITKGIFRFICIDFYLFPKTNGLTLLKPSKRLLLPTACVQIRGGEEKA